MPKQLKGKVCLFKKYTNLLTDNEVMNLPLRDFGLVDDTPGVGRREGNMVVSEVMNF